MAVNWRIALVLARSFPFVKNPQEDTTMDAMQGRPIDPDESFYARNDFADYDNDEDYEEELSEDLKEKDEDEDEDEDFDYGEFEEGRDDSQAFRRRRRED